MIECVNVMGLYYDCAEIQIWRAFCDEMLSDSEVMQYYREIMPKLVRAIGSGMDKDMVFKELYFSFVIPVVMAMDAGQEEVAFRIYLERITQIEKAWSKEIQRLTKDDD